MDNQVSESEIADYISQAVEESATENHNTTGVVTEDSVINMDYVGSIDGVEFDGGSAEDVEFDIAATPPSAILTSAKSPTRPTPTH